MESTNVHINSRLDDAKLKMRQAQALEKDMLTAYENIKQMAKDDSTISQQQISDAYFQYDSASRASSKAQSSALSEALRVYGDLALAHAEIDIFGLEN